MFLSELLQDVPLDVFKFREMVVNLKLAIDCSGKRLAVDVDTFNTLYLLSLRETCSI